MEANTTLLVAIVYWIFMACLCYYIIINAYYTVLFIVSFFENLLRVRQQSHEDFRSISRSRLTLPISVIVPAYNEELPIRDCIYSLIKLDYPQYEIIIVNDGSTDHTLKALISEFKLERRDMYARKFFTTEEVRAVYASAEYEELYLIDKANGGKADALNCGMNYARYPYICTSDADTVFEKDALLKAIRLILRDPEKTVGLGSLVAMSNGFWIESGAIRRRSIPQSPFLILQMLDYFRGFLTNRLAWSRMNFMLVLIGAFAIYRKDLLIELGGFSKEFSCEDIEMTFRLHEYLRRRKIDYHIYSLPDPVCWTEMPDTWRNLYRQRHRWQRVINETFWRYKRMFLNPKYGAVGLLGMPYYLIGEVLAPVFEILSVLVIPFAILMGIFSWQFFLTFMGIILLTNALTSVECLLIQDIGYRTFSFRDIKRMILVSFLEWFGFRQFLSYARLAGTIGFLRGEKGWRKFDRIKRENYGAEKK